MEYSQGMAYQTQVKMKKELEMSEMLSQALAEKYQYIYSSDIGEISLVKISSCFFDISDPWEIYCLEGNLFDGVDRFETKKQAEIEIVKLLKKNK